MLAARDVVIKIRFILPIKQPALYFYCRKPPTLNINKAFQLLVWLQTNIQPLSTSTEHLVKHFLKSHLLRVLLVPCRQRTWRQTGHCHRKQDLQTSVWFWKLIRSCGCTILNAFLGQCCCIQEIPKEKPLNNANNLLRPGGAREDNKFWLEMLARHPDSVWLRHADLPRQTEKTGLVMQFCCSGTHKK